MNLSACGKKGPLYLENPQSTETQEITKDKQAEKSAN